MSSDDHTIEQRNTVLVLKDGLTEAGAVEREGKGLFDLVHTQHGSLLICENTEGSRPQLEGGMLCVLLVGESPGVRPNSSAYAMRQMALVASDPKHLNGHIAEDDPSEPACNNPSVVSHVASLHCHPRLCATPSAT